MRILIDMWHPADVHFFKNFIKIMEKKGHIILITSRQKDVTSNLLDNYGFKHKLLTRKSKGIFGLGLELLKHDFRLYRLSRKFKPDILLGFGGMSIAHVGRLIGKPSISFYDSEHATMIRLVTMPFISTICTPKSFRKDYGKKHQRFNSFKELAYLHPGYYTPNTKALKRLNLEKGEPYFVIRLVSWEASHDIGLKGIHISQIRKLILLLKEKGKIFISSEDNKVPPDLIKYLLPTNPIDFFDVLNYAKLVISEGATTAKEAAFLGVPTIYINRLSAGDIQEVIRKYKLIFQTTKEAELYGLTKRLICTKGLKKEWVQRKEKLLKEKQDLTKWMVNYVESTY